MQSPSHDRGIVLNKQMVVYSGTIPKWAREALVIVVEMYKETM